MRVPFLPDGAEILSAELAVDRTGKGWVFYNASGPIFACESDDELGKRVIASQLVKLKLVGQGVICRVLGLHRVTLFRDQQKVAAGGARALEKKRRGPKGPHKLTAEVLRRAQELLDGGKSVQLVAEAVGVDASTIRRVQRSGQLRGKDGPVLGPNASEPLREAAAVPEPSPAAVPEPSLAAVPEPSPAAVPEPSPADGLSTIPGATEQAWEATVEVTDVFAKSSAEMPGPPAGDGVDLVGPSERAVRDTESIGGVAVRRHLERALASRGKLAWAGPAFEPAEAVRYAGVLLALPVLLEEGLLEVGEQVYRRLKNGYYGLCSVLLTLTMMALLRIRTPEQLGGHAPGELGVLVGLDRTPEVKTVRRKLAEMGEMKGATELQGLLAARWATDDPARVGLLYIDGHVRAYHGRKHRLPKTFSQKRRMCVPATTDTWVNDREGQPVFYVTAPSNEGMLAMLDDEALPAIKELCAGKPLTIVFDREGWSPERFRRWASEGIRVMTYRKGAYDDWAPEEFKVAAGRARGRRSLLVAERGVQLLPGFWVREIRRLCSNDHQTAIISTDFDQTVIEAAESMFDRWTQENFFRYGRMDFSLDHLVTRKVDPADPNRMAPNPDCKRVAKLLRAKKTELARAEQAIGRASTAATPEPKEPDLAEQARGLRADVASLAGQLSTLPKRVPISSVIAASELVELERERKRLTDTIKVTAYRAESTLVNILRPFYRRHEQEAHALLKSIYHTPADIIPDAANGKLIIRLHGLSTPRANRALGDLCRLMTETETIYPETRLRMVFETLNDAKMMA